MEPETSSPVFALYRIARSDGELMITDTQRGAIRMLGELSAGGNGEAREALVSLSRLPGYHILLREMAAAALVIRA